MPTSSETQVIHEAITTVKPEITNLPELQLPILEHEDFDLIPAEGISDITGNQHYHPFATGSYANVYKALSKAEATIGVSGGSKATINAVALSVLIAYPYKVEVVIKVFRDAHLAIGENKEEERKFIRRIRRECGVWKMLNHHNISQLWGIVIHPELSSAGLVSCYRKHGALDEFMQTGAVYDRVGIAEGIACALQYMHSFTPDPVVHGDLTPANILVEFDEDTKTYFPLLTDFGKSRVMEKRGYTTTVSKMTPLYRAPELFIESDDQNVVGSSDDPEIVENGDGNKCMFPGSDVYSLAMILYRLITDQNPFHKERVAFPMALSIQISDPENPLRMTKDKYPIPDEFDWCWPIMEGCWAYDAKERLTSKEVHKRLCLRGGPDVPSIPAPITIVAADETSLPSP
ncbi:kinase-like domain-containing protein [Ephemerocybe angulata]|uniref:Kinase-like domain-containing protein n=1 Tax=Ephemerocybe angulata TaxID=980116 RepID=A0A8H6HG56_9AGAR|nr:kinase-like domain-containing protein [Tulosesus angulatus]